jgi:hypothetical protein
MSRSSESALIALVALVAGALPPLLAVNLSPSATMLNQCAALALWGWWVAVLAPNRLPRAAWPLAAALVLVALAALWSMTAGSLPASLGLSAIGLLAAALVLAWAGADAAQRDDGAALFGAFADALLLAGLLSALVALAQVFAPDFGSPSLIARSGSPGRAIGNLRQPNQLASVLLWALIAAVLRRERGRLPSAAGWAAAALLVTAIELSGSRTGMVGVVVLALWGAVDRRLSRGSRRMLLALPLLFALAYGAMAVYGHWANEAIGAATRLADAAGIESPNARTNIWSDALAMIALAPWTGVGFGEFNLAWTLTAFPHRPTAFFDHTHNLVLQLAVELGLPLAGLVLALLGVALWRAWRRSSGASGDAAPAARAALLMVVTIGLHSMVEYPLWYAYFLLPAAFAWGYAVAVPAAAAPARSALPRWAGAACGIALVAGGCYAVVDYLRVTEIYVPGEDSGSLESRIARGQKSLFFAHHADYAAATSGPPGPGADLGFERAIHNLLDTRLMIAWARHLADTGHVDLARTLAQRLRDFRNPDADSFFAPCEAAARQESKAASAAGLPFQCEPPQARHDWREFVAAAAARH